MTAAIVRALRDAAQADWTRRAQDSFVLSYPPDQRGPLQSGMAVAWDRAIRAAEEAVAKEEAIRLRAMQMNAELPPEQAAVLNLKGMIG